MPSEIWIPFLCGDEEDYDAFWSQDLSWDTDNPDLTRCFLSIILLCAPSILMILTGIVLAVMYHNQIKLFKWRDKSWLNLGKFWLTVLLCILMCVELLLTIIDAIRRDKTVQPVRPITYLLLLIAFAMAAYLFHAEYQIGNHTSGTQQVFGMVMFLSFLLSLRSSFLQADYEDRDVETIRTGLLITETAIITVIMVLTFPADTSVFNHKYNLDTSPLLTPSRKENKATSNGNSEATQCPTGRVSRINDMLYLWFTKYLYLQWKRPLAYSDLPDIQDKDKSVYLVDKFYYFWRKEMAKSGRVSLEVSSSKQEARKTPSLFRALLYTLGWDYLVQNILRVIGLISFVNPYLLRFLLDFLEKEDDYLWKGVFLGTGMMFVSMVAAVINHRSLYIANLNGMNLRTLITGIVYRKSLKLSNASKKKTTLGEITNLMSVDAQKLQDFGSFSNSLFIFPISVLICTFLLVETIGYSSLVGIAILLFVIPFVGVACLRMVKQLQGVQMKWKDKRIRDTGEIFNGIKVLKLYSWEKPFQDKINEYRGEEISRLLKINIINALNFSLWMNGIYIVNCIVIAIFVYSSSNNLLDPSIVFVTFSLISMLSYPLMILPIGLNMTAQAIISFKRISDFLLLEESQSDAITYHDSSDCAIECLCADFTWDDVDKPFLRNIEFNINHGELIAVVGQIGCGKSSLASALLGEMVKVKGHVNINGTIAYVPQHAWIQHTTLKNNILFGNRPEESKYQYILDACALRPDLKILADGDMTEIGEKGINLSGGQKQRVSLARAVFQDSDIYIMDDPLSAVDAHVASHLFNEVIGPCGMLAQKTRILITHSVTYLPHASRIIVMLDGRIAKIGTYDELNSEDGFFANFLKTYMTNGHEDDDVTEPEGTTLRKRTDFKRSDSVCSERNSEEVEQHALITEESEEVGSVKWAVFKDYIGSWGIGPATTVTLFTLLYLAFNVGSQIWISLWSMDSVEDQPSTRDYRFGVHAALVTAQVACAAISFVALAFGTTGASKFYHSRMIGRLLKAPMSFYDTTPLGRIMNRCSKDTDYLDSGIPFFLRLFLINVTPLFATYIIISYSTPLFLLASLPLFIFYGLVQRLFVDAVRQIKRIESVRKSPLFSHYEESVTGATIIRAYGKVEEFIGKSDRLTDESLRGSYMYNISSRWLSILLEFVGAIIILMATCLALWSRDDIGAGTAGLSVSYALQISTYLMLFVRCTAELETFMVAAERVKEYSEIKTEASYTIPETRPRNNWPSSGAVQYDNYSTRYRPGLDLVLSNISFDIKGSEKIGVVGRTGAGKSSVALSLFRIIEASAGMIRIDSVPIDMLGLHDLRSKLTIIPQDPVVFSGTLRFNVDPLGGASDSQIWTVLGQAHLKKAAMSFCGGLDYDCGEMGSNLSVGQRQLVCLARALLRKSKILLLDEATSGVDLETDDLIQATIRRCFKECTVITIAHRINTILDYDRVMVLDAGRVIEFDKPSTLLNDKTSMFAGLVKSSHMSNGNGN